MIEVPDEDYNEGHFISESLPSDILNRLNGFRYEKRFFDFTIVVEGERYPAHKQLLIACSEYFEKMLSNENFRESRQNEVEIQGITKDAVRAILNYFYTSRLILNPQNAQEVLVAASIMQITAVRNFCSEFIKDKLSIHNCLGILEVAHIYNLDELSKTAMSFCLDKFEQIVCDEESEFSNLDKEWLISIVSNDQLNVSIEANVYDAVMKWLAINDDPDAKDDLLPHIRFPLMDLPTLFNIQLPPKYQYLISEAKDYHLVKMSICPEISSRKSLMVGPRFNRRVSARQLAQRIFAVGGWTNEFRPIASVEKYNPYEDTWEEVSPMMSRRCGVGAAILGNWLYAVGGHDGSNYLKTVERYNISENFWKKDVASMNSDRTSFGVVSLDGYIYAIGGQVNSANSTSGISASCDVERYNPILCKWEACAPLQEKRLGAGVTVLNGSIYVVGGANLSPTATVECYNPGKNVWTYVEPMTTSRKHLGCASCDGKVYAVGGRDSSNELASAECYDPEKRKWEPVPPMSEKRSGIGLVELNGLLYAVGGHNGDMRLTLVEAYDPKSKVWIDKAPLIQERLGAGLAVYSTINGTI